ncbi:hypothetical protein DFP72DRAFT_1165948 [Ephemerocybe angulata]|uniref:Fungal-type protein kinase domain-containing protein n=1 Tax=Ephemerocybe angulata TaxID=980116 RepID=A0A8H6MA95_9AGAR|nr:hypothetical protein DFP72DRAFT_1165948 [Tulosesus angulatus]
MLAPNTNTRLSRVQTRSQTRANPQDQSTSARRVARPRLKQTGTSFAVPRTLTNPTPSPPRATRTKNNQPNTASSGKVATLDLSRGLRQEGSRRPTTQGRPRYISNALLLADETVKSNTAETTRSAPPRNPSPTLTSSETESQDSEETQEDKSDPLEQRKAAISDLHDITTVDGACLKDFYKATASDRRIKNFLSATSLYDYGSNAWTDIPRDAQRDEDLHGPFMKVINGVLEGPGQLEGAPGMLRVAGTIATLDPSGRRIKYKLDPDSFCFAAQTVRGRGTVCWNAENKDGKRILIKDAWRTDPQVPEYTFLERTKGLEGVVQLLAHQGSVARTRCFPTRAASTSQSDDFYNRTMSRVTMVRCGASLSQFTSQFQAIAAIRDAIQGHLNLLKAGVLHRDVSMNNILFGDDEATVGNGGVLIDLDMAIMVKGPSADIITELPAGTHLYQSISVLDYKGELVPVPHDYLDDLESFFYILCHLLYGYEGFDRPAPAAFTGMKVLALWENMPAEAATNMKLRYIELEGPNINKPPLFWSTTCIKLCDTLRRYLLPLIDGKIKLRVTRDDVERRARAKELHKELEKHYSDIIALSMLHWKSYQSREGRILVFCRFWVYRMLWFQQLCFFFGKEEL